MVRGWRGSGGMGDDGAMVLPSLVAVEEEGAKRESMRACCQRVSSPLKFVVPERKMMGRGRLSRVGTRPFPASSASGVMTMFAFGGLGGWDMVWG